jgi:hypothetical protein
MTSDNDNHPAPTLAEELFLRFVEAEALPAEAMREAVANWPEVSGFFVTTLQGYASGEYDPVEDGDALLFLVHLFSQMRETAACKPLLELLAGPVETLEAVLGDTLDETLPSIMTGIFDGDADPLEALILDPGLDPFVRWPLFESYAALVLLERIGTMRAERVLLAASDAELDADDPAWCGWLTACAAIATPALLARAREKLTSGAAAPEGFDAAHFEAEVARWRDDQERALVWLKPIDDAVEELASWHGFTEAGLAARRKAARLGASIGRDTIVNPYRGIGRNDPCPCGSGKKFKKCHGA